MPRPSRPCGRLRRPTRANRRGARSLYERPPLSKDYLQGKVERETIYVHPVEWYAEHHVDLRLGIAVTGIDPAAHEVTLADDTRVRYAKLLTTGSTLAGYRCQAPGSTGCSTCAG